MLKKFEQIVNNHKNDIAYIVNKEQITYAELWQSAKIQASLLKRQDNKPVIIYGDKEIFVIITILACLICKRTYIPISYDTPIDRIKKIISLSDASLIISKRKIQIPNIDICNFNSLEKYKNCEIKDCKSDIAYIIFTSGSTGEPKGVPISTNNLNNFIKWISNLSPLSNYKNIKVLNQANFSFDLSVTDLYYSLCNGHTLFALDNKTKEDISKIYNVIEKVNLLVITPTFMKLLLLDKSFNSNNYPILKCIYFCGERLEKKIVKKIFELFPNINIINAYGPTEATSAVSAILIDKNILDKEEELPIGNMTNTATNIEIIDDEIVLKGNSVFSGYLNKYTGGYYKENNINCFKTGDIGFIKADKLYFKCRKDNQIKYKGYRIELDDIENNIKSIKQVKDCAVIAKYDDLKNVKTLKSFIVLNDKVEEEYIKEKLKKMLPQYMLPKSFVFIDSLPVNTNNKIDRKALSKL